MIEYENECVGCPTELGCLGKSCPNLSVPHLYCDQCGSEVDTLREYDGQQLCEECLLDQFDIIEV